jgi:hypothetical protein
MENSDCIMTVMRLVDVIAKQSQREKLLEKRRADARYPVEVALPVAYKLATPGTFVAEGRASTVDISYHGVGLLMSREVETRSMITICMLPFDMPDTYVPARVVFCRMIMPHVYRVGAEFLFEEMTLRKHVPQRLIAC